MCGSQGKRKRNGGKKVNCYVEHEKGGGVLIRITIVPRSQPRQSPRCKLSDPAPPHSSAVFSSSSDIIVISNGRVEEKRKRKELFIFFAPCFLLCPSSVAFGVDGEEGGACATAMGGWNETHKSSSKVAPQSARSSLAGVIECRRRRRSGVLSSHRGRSLHIPTIHTRTGKRRAPEREKSTSTSSLLAGRGRRLGTAAAAASLVGVGALLAAVLREGERTESVVSRGAAAPPFGGQERRKGPLLYCIFASSHRTPRLSSLPLFSVYPLFLSSWVGGRPPGGGGGGGHRRREEPAVVRGRVIGRAERREERGS